MGIIIKYISTLFEREKWKLIFLTKTQKMRKTCTSSRKLSRPQTHSSWMSNAHNATQSTLSSQMHKKFASAPTANISWPSQEVERLSLPLVLLGEERVTEQSKFLIQIDEWIRTQKLKSSS